MPAGHHPRGGRGARLAEEQRERPGGGDSLVCPERVRAADSRAHHPPRVLVPERRVAARRHAHPRVDEGTQPPQVRQVAWGHVGCVLLAAFDDEMRLRDDRQPAQGRQ